MEHLKWFLSKKSFGHLIPLFVFGVLKNLLKDTTGFQIYHYGLIFRINPSCQTLSKAFDMSKNTPLTSRSLPNDWYILWVIETSWFMQESPGRKPEWLDDNKLFSFKNLYSLGTALAFSHSIGNLIWLRHDLRHNIWPRHDLCSCKWLILSLCLVVNLISLGFWKLQIKCRDDFMNWKMFLKDWYEKYTHQLHFWTFC